MPEQRIKNWGGYPQTDAQVWQPQAFDAPALPAGLPIIARGNGRCYGDSALQKNIVSTLRWNKILRFDKAEGVICCEAGVLLSDVLELIVPHGFFLPVTPGTKYITAGGAVAANVHGKNHHHAGAFGRYVESLELIDEAGVGHFCSREVSSKLFKDAIGGMGLTGIIATVCFRLSRIATAYIRQQAHPATNLEALIDLMKRHHNAPYLVAWVEALQQGKAAGRGIVFSGRHTMPDDLDRRAQANPLKLHAGKQTNVPFYLPASALNRFTIGLYNARYYRRNSRQREAVVHYDDFFYPLDKLRNWNRIYGRTGFVQYQCVLPPDAARKGYAEILQAIAQSGCGAFLAVLKKMGIPDGDCAPISFPMQDYASHPAFIQSLDGLPDVVVSVFGYLGNQEQAVTDFDECSRILSANFTGQVSLLNLVAGAMKQRGHGAIIGIASVAGDRGRGSNYLYGSAKAGFAAYLSGLRNALFPHGVHVATIKPGFVRTKMIEGMATPKSLTATPEGAARAVWRAYHNNKNVVYVLPVWRWIMLVIRLIPEPIFKRLKL